MPYLGRVNSKYGSRTSILDDNKDVVELSDSGGKNLRQILDRLLSSGRRKFGIQLFICVLSIFSFLIFPKYFGYYG